LTDCKQFIRELHSAKASVAASNRSLELQLLPLKTDKLLISSVTTVLYKAMSKPEMETWGQMFYFQTTKHWA